MNRKDRGILIGTLLGDSSIHRIKKGNCVFQFTHQIKQKDYAFYKYDLIKKMFGGNPKEPKYYQTKTRFGEVEYFKFGFSNKYFNFLHRVLYNIEGNKEFSEKVLNYLTPHGIALWYMDDGGISLGPRLDKNGEPRRVLSVEMRISTYCSLEEIDTITNYFLTTWGIQAKKRYSKKNDLYYLAFNTQESKKLEEIIQKYILPNMKYKLPSFYNTRAQNPSVSEGDDIV